MQTIEDDNSGIVPAGEMIRILMEDNGHIAKLMQSRYATRTWILPLASVSITLGIIQFILI